MLSSMSGDDELRPIINITEVNNVKVGMMTLQKLYESCNYLKIAVLFWERLF